MASRIAPFRTSSGSIINEAELAEKPFPHAGSPSIAFARTPTPTALDLLRTLNSSRASDATTVREGSLSLGSASEMGAAAPGLSDRVALSAAKLFQVRSESVISVEPAGKASATAEIPPDITDLLSSIAGDGSGYLHGENSFLSFLLLHVYVMNPSLFNEINLAFQQTNPIDKIAALHSAFTKAEALLDPSAVLQHKLCRLGIRLCEIGRIDLFNRRLNEYLDPHRKKACYFDETAMLNPQLRDICNDGLHAVHVLAHNLFHVHKYGTFFFDTLGDIDIPPIPDPSCPLSTFSSLTQAQKARIDEELASHPYFRNVPPALRKRLCSMVFSFLREARGVQSEFCKANFQFASLGDSSIASMVGLHKSLVQLQTAESEAPVLFKIMAQHYEPLLTRRRMWHEHMQWILHQGRQIAEDQICLLYLFPYLQSDLSAWNSVRAPDLKREVLAFASSHPDLTHHPEAERILTRLHQFETVLQTAGVFLDELNGRWAEVERQSRIPLMKLHGLYQKGIFTRDAHPAPLGSIVVNLAAINFNAPLKLECGGYTLVLRFTKADSSEPTAAVATTTATEAMEAPPAEDPPATACGAGKSRESSHSALPLRFSEFFISDLLQAPPLKALGAQNAFRNAYFYAEDLHYLLRSPINRALSPQQLVHELLDRAYVGPMMLEQILTALMLVKQRITKPEDHAKLIEATGHRLQERLGACELDSLFFEEECDLIYETVSSSDRLELGTRELPRSFKKHPLLTACHHIMEGTASAAAIDRTLREAFNLGKRQLQVYVTLLRAFPAVAPHVPERLVDQLHSLDLKDAPATEMPSAAANPVSDLFPLIHSKMPTGYHPLNAENEAVIFYLLHRLDYFYQGLSQPAAFRLSEIQARLALRNLVEEVLYFTADYLEAPIERRTSGHDVEIVALAIGLEEILTPQENVFLASHRQFRNEARYAVEDTAPKAGATAKVHGGGAAASSETAFVPVLSAKKTKMLARLDQELAVASSIISKALDLTSGSSKPRKAKGLGKKDRAATH